MFVKNKAMVASRVGCSERGVICTFESCCLSPIRRNSVLEELREKICSHPKSDVLLSILQVSDI